jgi:hypothetical protein
MLREISATARSRSSRRAEIKEISADAAAVSRRIRRELDRHHATNSSVVISLLLIVVSF